MRKTMFYHGLSVHRYIVELEDSDKECPRDKDVAAFCDPDYLSFMVFPTNTLWKKEVHIYVD